MAKFQKIFVNLVEIVKKSELKQVIVAREDLKLPPGKLAVQVAHASVSAVLKSSEKILERWSREGMKKVVVKVGTEKKLKELEKKAKDLGLKTALISDAGLTVLKPGTVTCLGIGPDSKRKIDRVTGKLRVL